MVQIHGNKFIHSVHYHWLMAPHEKLWRPVIAMPEQCNFCQRYFHEDIGGICSPCYQVMSRELYNQPVETVSGGSVSEASNPPELVETKSETAGVGYLQEDVQRHSPADVHAEEE